MEKYLNDAIIGNENITVSFNKQGELLRFFYPTTDYKQFFERVIEGVKVNESALVPLHDDINNEYKQTYVESTNILKTEIWNRYFKLKIEQIDYVPMNENFMVKKYKFINQNEIEERVHFLFYAKSFSDFNNDTCGFVKNNTLMHYTHDYTSCIFSNQHVERYQVNGAGETIFSACIGGKDYIGMSRDSSICYDMGVLKPQEEKEITLYIYVNDNQKYQLVNTLENELERIKELDEDILFSQTKTYWEEYTKKHSNIDRKYFQNDKVKQIYERTILLYPLLTNKKTGGISAAVEVDEAKTYCGRYSYCWPRDAAFITKAMDRIGMDKEAENFYQKFCKSTQNIDGSWEQRFYTDGRLAPSWGYQIDETASVIYGAYEHYKMKKKIQFLIDIEEMCQKASQFLERWIQSSIGEKAAEYNLPKSYDLWEENEGISIYSLASIYGAFEAMIGMQEVLSNSYDKNEEKKTERQEQIERLQQHKKYIKQYIETHFYHEGRNSFIRNTEDNKIDMSILGIIIPFQLFDSKEERVQHTIDRINETIRTKQGGYLRYEQDHYRGGKHPWPITTLWMALYYLEKGEKEKAEECFFYAVNSASEHGFLAEQVNDVTKEPTWVIGLNWSHAMFIEVLYKMIEQ